MPTITKIIGVVPMPIRILIAALAALAFVLAVNSRLALRRAARLARQRRQLLDDVGVLQGALLPTPAERVGSVGTSVAYLPADGPGAGGDFYDLFALADGRLAVIVGDLSGHGRSALPHTALVRFTLRAYLDAGLPPRDALQTAAGVLERQLDESFATVVVATYDPRARVLVYACAGHPPPIVLGPRALEPVTLCSSPPIGAGLPTGRRQTVVSLPGQSLVCFYTDGIAEARVAGQLFGAARIAQTLGGLAAGATASTLLQSVAEKTDRRPDDMAACLLRLDGDAHGPVVRTEELELDAREAAGPRPARFLVACGVDPEQTGELMRAARTAVQRAGSVVLEVRLGVGKPVVELREQNVTVLHQPARATVGVS